MWEQLWEVISIPSSVFEPFAGLSLWSGSAVAKAEVNRQRLQDNLDGL